MSLISIPAGSRLEAELARANQVLRTLRDVAREAGVLNRFYLHDHARRSSLEALRFEGEHATEPYGLEYYGALHHMHRKPGADPEALGRMEGPSWVRFGTESRLTWGRVAPLMLEALRGMPVGVGRDTSWRWDNKRPNADGSPRLVTRYEFLVILNSRADARFDPKSLVDALAATHCMAEDPLADRCLFTWQQELIGDRVFSGYAWTRNGLTTSFETRKALGIALTKLFAAYECTVTKQPKDVDFPWHLEVDLTKFKASAAA